MEHVFRSYGKKVAKGDRQAAGLISTPFTPFRSDSSPDADLQRLFVVRHRRKCAGVTGDSKCTPHGTRLSFGVFFRIILGILNIPETFFSTSERIGKQFCFLLQIFFFCYGAATQRGSWPPHSRGFLDHTQRRIIVGRTPLNE